MGQMPCPYFEPQAVAAHSSLRLPLLDEYRGLCHVTAEPTPAPDDMRLVCCNHGYSYGVCPRLPIAEDHSSNRFDVVQATADALELLYIEEKEHAPLRWHSVRFEYSTGALDPFVKNTCAAAQIRAFSRSFLRRFGKRG